MTFNSRCNCFRAGGQSLSEVMDMFLHPVNASRLLKKGDLSVYIWKKRGSFSTQVEKGGHSVQNVIKWGRWGRNPKNRNHLVQDLPNSKNLNEKRWKTTKTGKLQFKKGVYWHEHAAYVTYECPRLFLAKLINLTQLYEQNIAKLLSHVQYHILLYKR